MALGFLFAIKTHYGGEILIRLNEPDSFTYSSSNYSDIVFYALIHENLFFLKPNNEIYSHIFDQYSYDRTTRILSLQLKNNLSFSDGSQITEKEVRLSLNLFLNKNLLSAKKLRRIIKNIKSENNRILIELLYDRPDITGLLTVPELVLVSGKPVYSGIFYPHEWVKNRYIILRPNTYYPGGRSYLDSVKVLFTDQENPDVFLGEPGGFREHGYQEFDSGIFQNVYICFPKGDVGNNTRSALFTLLRDFYQSRGGAELNSLTSDQESPVTISINRMPGWRMRSVLKYSKINLYVLSSLKSMETVFEDFLKQKGVPLEIIYISENQLVEYLSNTPIKFLLLEKVFSNRMTPEEKVIKILQEMSFGRFDEKYLKAVNELDELKFLNNDELLMDHIARIIEQMINDGILLPISQKRYSLFFKKGIRGIDIDYYGRPLFQNMGLE